MKGREGERKGGRGREGAVSNSPSNYSVLLLSSHCGGLALHSIFGEFVTIFFPLPSRTFAYVIFSSQYPRIT